MKSNWTINAHDEELRLTPQASLQLLRVALEASTNILKHAHATHVQIDLRHAQDTLELQIVDDGRGDAFQSPRPST